jgi:hypothetical protein
MAQEIAVQHPPLIKRKRNGGVFVLVWTKRLYRGRTVTRDGLAWLRAKYPADVYPNIEATPFNYDDYHEMKALGFIGFKDRRTTEQGRRSEQSTARDSTPARPRQNSDAPRTSTQPPTPAQYCCGCGGEIQPQARFCPRCGCMTGNATINDPPPRISAPPVVDPARPSTKTPAVQPATLWGGFVGVQLAFILCIAWILWIAWMK